MKYGWVNIVLFLKLIWRGGKVPYAAGIETSDFLIRVLDVFDGYELPLVRL